ncbi:hypothetical protein [Nostoc sp. PA-18-2419]|uniref:hypothetical protein n=1 Tax=Nostoc sp. PA-18-2419 TaxID=2575443 RepID=UPI001109A304|nr:hypothetical protein [Nostoc sp. PA-18-2419]
MGIDYSPPASPAPHTSPSPQSWQLLPRPDRRSLHNSVQVIHDASTTCMVTLSPRVQHLPPHPS